MAVQTVAIETLQRWVKITFTPLEYLRVLSKYRSNGSFLAYSAGPNYWEYLPRYKIAECPWCQQGYYESVDTHSLLPWHFHFQSTNRVFQFDIDKPCKHFMGVQKFLHFNGYEPVIFPGYDNLYNHGLIYPRIATLYITPKFDTQVVMQCLPICRIEEKQFVPRYTAYALSYYSQNPQALVDERLAYLTEQEIYGIPWLNARPGTLGTEKTGADLPYWVEQKRLLWIDNNQDNLPLRDGPATDFPYYPFAEQSMLPNAPVDFNPHIRRDNE